MLSYFSDNRLVVVCAECRRNGFDCPYPTINNTPYKKEEPSCSLGEPNLKLETEVKMLNYQIAKVTGKLNNNNNIIEKEDIKFYEEVI